MLNVDKIIRFFALFLGFYFLLILFHTVPSIESAHNKFFATFEEIVFNTFHPRSHVDFSTDVESEGIQNMDVVLKIYDTATYKSFKSKNRGNTTGLKPRQLMAFPANQSYRLPTIFLLALLFATPMSWKRKLVSTIVAMFLLYVLLAMKVTYLMDFEDGKNTSGGSLWHFLSGIVGTNKSYDELFYLFVLNIWAIVSFSKEGVKNLFSATKVAEETTDATA